MTRSGRSVPVAISSSTRGNGWSRVGAAGAKGRDLCVHLDQRDRGVRLEQDPGAGAKAVRGRRARRQRERNRVGRDHRGNGKRPQALRIAVDDLGTQILSLSQPLALDVAVDDPRGAKRQGDLHPVEPNARRAAGDEHLAARPLTRGRARRAASRRRCCRRRWRPPPPTRRREAARACGRKTGRGRSRRGTHPIAAERAEPVHGEERHALAIARQSAAATHALSARNLERHTHARPLLGTAVRRLNHLGHALVPDGNRRFVGRPAGDDRRVEVARGHGERADQRIASVLALRGVDVPPLQTVRLDQRQLPHPPTVLRRVAALRTHVPLTSPRRVSMRFAWLSSVERRVS